MSICSPFSKHTQQWDKDDQQNQTFAGEQMTTCKRGGVLTRWTGGAAVALRPSFASDAALTRRSEQLPSGARTRTGLVAQGQE
jgi:hypothetical protein